MAAASRRTDSIRKRKRATRGVVRKGRLRRLGSTLTAAELFKDKPAKAAK
ncbi:MAG: hypothetical protein HAW63_05935 [Bdellovibrionaceae bacterium]|nr:hypothetical protein [Pseudobdellovibrionaceae bacterium]